MDELFRLHAARWEGRAETGMLSGQEVQDFHREVARRFVTQGLLGLYAIYVNGQCIAVQYNFFAKGRAYAYLSGFDRAWDWVSPGSLLLEHAMGDAIAAGARDFDFLRKQESYKYGWGARDERTWRLQARR